MPYVVTERPEWDKFPGADYTFAVDTLMPDGKALQIGTAHNLGQNFAEAFEVDFETEDGEHDYVYQTSYGVSERCIAAVMGVHGDDNGLVLPSEVAPTQVAVVPIPFGDDEENAEIMETCEEMVKDLEDAGIRAELDDSDENPGAKYYKWELKGTPLRAEVGPRDLESGSAKLVNRLGEESEADFDSVAEDVRDEMDDLSDEIRTQAADNLDDSIVESTTYDETVDVVGDGFALVGWNGDVEDGKRIEEKVGVDMLGEPRGYDIEDTGINECIETGDQAEKVVLLANTY